MSTARSSVTAFTSQLGEGLHSVVESVESALDVPPPEEIARAEAQKKAQLGGAGDETVTEEKKEEKEKEEKEEEKKEEKEKEETKKKEEKKQEGAQDAGWWNMTSSVMTSAQKTVSPRSLAPSRASNSCSRSHRRARS